MEFFIQNNILLFFADASSEAYVSALYETGDSVTIIITNKKNEITLKKNGWIESHSIVPNSVVSRYALMLFVLFA